MLLVYHRGRHRYGLQDIAMDGTRIWVSITCIEASNMIEMINTGLKRYTFKSPNMKKWVESNSSGLVLNLFAGRVKLDLDEVRNDIDKGANAEYNYDALDFVAYWEQNKKELFDTVILDPPYSYRKAMEMYKGNYSSRFKRIADQLPNIIKTRAKVISFGYHSTFLGKKRGYKLNKMCVFAHGGAQHCTIAIIEKQKRQRK